MSAIGTVWVECVVDTFGNSKDIKIKRGIMRELDNEAIRVVKVLTFIPARLKGETIELKLNIPVRFKPE